jgi:hypothetical protein
VATDPGRPTDAGGEVSVSISYFGWDAHTKEVEVGSFVQGVVESDGSCTLTLTKGTSSVQTTAAAIAAASSTSCTELDTPGSRLPSGSWKAVVTYRSSTSHGSSRAVEVTVP